MKKRNFLAVAVVFSLVFSSCSSEEEALMPEQSKELFKTFELKRDATGAYSIDLDLDSNVKVAKVKNTAENINELYLSVSDDDLEQKSNLQSDLFFDDENFKVDFITENSNKVPSISIFDDNIKYVKKSDDSFLEEYSVIKNENGTYELDFKVSNNVSVDFVYNDEISVYEVHLEESGKSQQNDSYSRTLEKEENELLQIHFVNHTGDNAKGDATSADRKPVIIIDDGEDW
ncbi:hypothetical protein SAMN05216503_2619 [Polaribacter sp. KT25b]|uniref:hypothetical protein n=1 Tax=Polaribacter sp. KT25b TaxID=1855336 RepID=UPI00087D5D91|nr:hypothetical protein [Polaribacter sp. KT25b]SDS30129.1 hypothetical protein SAMN05216503_2619 [Polaribacter sp. KT25b]